MNEIKKEWDEYRTIPFPDKLAFEEVGGIDLALIDSSAAGCIDSFIDDRNLSENDCVRILNECATNINKVKYDLDGNEKEYIDKLYSLILMVLKKVNH